MIIALVIFYGTIIPMAARQTKSKSKRKTAIKSVTKKETPVESMKSGVEKKRYLKKVNRKYFYLLIVLIILGVLVYLGRISRIEVIKELEKQGGQQALDGLVTKALIDQEAQKQNVTISSDVVNKEVERISVLIEAQGQTLDAYLTMQGQTKENFEQNIKIQKTVEQIIKDKIQVTEEEMKKYFDDNPNLFAAGSKYENVKEDVEQQLKQQKLSEEFQKWLEEVRKNTSVRYFVNY